MKPEDEKPKKKNLYLIQLPPPVHGVSAMNQIVINNPLINKKFASEVVELKFSDSFSGIRKYNFKKAYRFFKVYFNLRKKLKDFSPDLVYFSFIPVGIGFFRDFLFLTLIRLYKSKIVIHIHNRGINEISGKWIYRLLYRLAFQNIAIIHVSEGLMREEFQHIPARNCNKFVINNTCEPSKTGISEKKDSIINILFLSNLFPEKGVGIAIEAFTELSKSFPYIRLHIYGQALRAKYEREITKYIHSNKLTDKILFHGPANSKTKSEAFSQADIFIFPSYFKEECMPLSLLEAMQAGLPIIATRIGAIPEMIEDGVNGLLIEPNNVQELIGKISLVVENIDLRKKLGVGAMNTFQKKYSYEEFNKNFFRIINDVLSKQ
jgi:glycosyltransferase involved in cell wall biosynthesis